MPVSVAIYAKTVERLRPRLDALDLDITLVPFTADGHFMVDGNTVAPEEMDLDYMWLSPDLSADGVVPVTFDMAARTRSIAVLQTFNAGLDHPAYKKISQKGVRICNSSAQAIAISEYVMAHVLDRFQPLQKRRELQQEKKWERTPFREIAGTNWLIFGFGPIGRNVAQRAKAFGANITVIRRSPQTSEIVDRAGTLEDAPSFLPDTDVVVLACPLNDATRGMVGETFLDHVKPGALLVNIARGAIIDDAALMAALDGGKLDAAVLDVFHEEPLPATDPLWSHPKVVLTAHTSFGGSGVRQRWDDLFFENLPRYVSGESLLNEVAPGDI
jgi:phosphoglycerate dehydrogenase-like enzyme